VDKIGGRIDSVFNCAGLPGPPFSDVDVLLVNFVGMRHLAELVIPRMTEGGAIASISSTAGSGWMGSIPKWMPLVTTHGFAAGQVLIIWTLWRSFELAKQGIRINTISPGPTQTPMMPAFEAYVGKDFMENFPIPLGRRSTPEEPKPADSRSSERRTVRYFACLRLGSDWSGSHNIRVICLILGRPGHTAGAIPDGPSLGAPQDSTGDE
jgi:NAD(P)-dependent dehydrogenase (short-subunit alcohol dehydrogenase family)